MKRYNAPIILLREEIEQKVNSARIRGERPNFYNAILSRLNLSGIDLHDTNLIKVDFKEANLSRANLSGTKLNNADLSRANLKGANLTGADLSGAQLNETKYSRETKWPEGYTLPAGMVFIPDEGTDEGTDEGIDEGTVEGTEETLKDTLCVLCLKPNPDTTARMELSEKTFVSARRVEASTYTYPLLPFHERCFIKFQIERWIVHPLLVAAGVWILGMLIVLVFGGFTSLKDAAGWGTGLLIFALLASYFPYPALGLSRMLFEGKLEKWKVASYGSVLSPIPQQPQGKPEKTEKE